MHNDNCNGQLGHSGVFYFRLANTGEAHTQTENLCSEQNSLRYFFLIRDLVLFANPTEKTFVSDSISPLYISGVVSGSKVMWRGAGLRFFSKAWLFTVWPICCMVLLLSPFPTQVCVHSQNWSCIWRSFPMCGYNQHEKAAASSAISWCCHMFGDTDTALRSENEGIQEAFKNRPCSQSLLKK